MSNNTKRLWKYVAVTVGCAIFSAVYEHFSHQVYSVYMVYLFVIPLMLGVVPTLLAMVWPSLALYNGWHSAILAFAVTPLTGGSALQGVVEIYGTTSDYISYYFIVGWLFLGISLLCGVIHSINTKQSRLQK